LAAAEYAGHPLIPPYLQKGADLSHGANFGSGGAGVLPETNKGLVTLSSCFFSCSNWSKKSLACTYH